MSERRYTDEEVALILREASEVGEGGRGPGASRGLTLAQLKEIAEEVGLDPSTVESAAHRLVLQRAGRRVPFFGTPVAPEFEREIPGALSPDDVGEIVTTIRRVLGRRGVTESELGAFEWKARDGMGGRYVSVLPRDGATRLRVFGNFRDGVFLTSTVGGMAVLTVVAALLSALGLKDLVGAGILPLAAVVAVLPVRSIWRWRYRKEEDALAELTEALDQQVRALVEARASRPATPDPADDA